MDEVVNITDSAGIITNINGVFNNRFGYTVPDMKGKQISKLAALENPFSINFGGFDPDQKSVRIGKFIAGNKTVGKTANPY